MSNVVSISTGFAQKSAPALALSGAHLPAPLSDAEARVRALDTESSCIVEAPAGSGKTGLLMQRLLKLLAHPGVSAPEEVLAITFTNKATAELRHRVLEQLHLASARPLPGLKPFELETHALAARVLERDRQLGWGLLERSQRLNIRTIDSVAGEISRSLPLLSGSGGLREPTEDAEPLYREAARRTLAQLGGPDLTLHNALRIVLLHRDANLADCESLLARMLGTREQWGELVPLGPGTLDDAALDAEVRPRLERSLEKIVCEGLSRAQRALPAGLLEELAALGARLGLEPGYGGKVSPIAVCAGKDQAPEAVAEHLDHWNALIGLLIKPSDGGWRASFAVNRLSFKMPAADVAWLKQQIAAVQTEELREALCAVRCLPPARYPQQQWVVARALFHLLRRALVELKLLFAERGECDFSEFALSAREALRADPGAANFVSSAGERLQHLLVDEMQDTSSGQYELIELLTRSWDGHSQTLFLVGDPKQSIYLFRQARVERFLRTVRERRLGDLRLEPLRLTANFRSQAKIVGKLNDVFSKLFPTPEASLRLDAAVAVPFVPAFPARAAEAAYGVEWHPALPANPPSGETLSPAEAKFRHARAEALAIRRIVEGWRARPLPPERTKPWRVAVLARVRGHLISIIEEFKSSKNGAPIRFRAVDIDSLAERPEVLDALALIRALLHPADRIAWLAVLHAPWCGLGLADLLRLTGEGSEASPDATVAELVEARAHLLSREGGALLARCWPVLQTAAVSLGRAPLAVQVERTWRSLGGDAPLTPESRSNVLRVFAILHELGAEGSLDLTALTSRVARLYAEPVAGDADVELMTIHKAKGLEWDVVIVPGMERGERHSDSDLLNWLELDSDSEEEAHIHLAPIWTKGESSDQLNRWIGSMRSARESAERKRLFYVACTRAQEELHVFAAAKLTAKGELARPGPTSLLKACWPVAGPLFEQYAAAHLARRDARTTSASPASISTEGDDLRRRLTQALAIGEEAGLDLAAAGDSAPQIGDAADEESAVSLPPPLLHRLPLSFDPLARFNTPASERLDYPCAADLPQSPGFDRPEGSFSVRAFGNVVHRYLQLLSERQAGGNSVDELLAELLSWESRLSASLRGEGLAPSLASRDALRALRSLEATLRDPDGRWILSPHPAAIDEGELTAPGGRTLRADRIFTAGPAPGLAGESCVWIVDFKTSDPGARAPAAFEEEELAKYRPQLQAYAEIYRSATSDDRPVNLGLYYPARPRLITWKSI